MMLIAQAAEDPSLLEALLLTWLPLLVIGGAAWYLFRSGQRMQAKHMERGQRYMDAMEAKADRTNKLLEQILERDRK